MIRIYLLKAARSFLPLGTQNKSVLSGKKKLLLLGDVNSIHLIRWIKALASDYEIGVFSFNGVFDETKNQLNHLNVQYYCNKSGKKSSKWLYLFQLNRLRKAIKLFQPHLIHAHYASSYGLLAALSAKQNFILSAWGSDVFEFPKKSRLHRSLLKFVFSKAKVLLSTSKVMAEEMKNYTSTEIAITPFGVDTGKFVPLNAIKENKPFVVGTVKSLEDVYGIDILIRAFAIFHIKFPESTCHVYGHGSKLEEYQELVNSLKLGDYVQFKGQISHDEVPQVLNSMDVFCAFSRSESFGVAVLEASSCGLPVIVSNIGGLREVVEHEHTGFLVDVNNLNEISDKMVYFARDNAAKIKMGKAGRAWVEEHYSWDKSLLLMKSIYASFLEAQETKL